MKNTRGQTLTIAIVLLALFALGTGTYFVVKNLTGNAITGNVVSDTGNAVQGGDTTSNNPAPAPTPAPTPTDTSTRVTFYSGGGGGGGTSPAPDTTAPVITLLGNNPQVIELGSGYTELGATTDDSSPVVINASSFVDAVGTYTVTYNSVDAVGNNALEVVRTVIVDDTVIKAANRLIVLQDDDGLPSIGGNPAGAVDGSWDWYITNKNAPTGTTYLNIAGMTAEGLLDAYEITGDVKYLDAAKVAGNYIITELNKLPEAQHFNAFNMVFLQDLADLSGDTTYSTFVSTKMNDLLTKVTYWKDSNGVSHDISTDETPGLTAAELVAAENVIRGSAVQGIIPWDLFHFVQLAEEAGNNAYATEIANGIKIYVEDLDYVPTVSGYGLGLAAGVMGLKRAGLDYSSSLTRLLAEQKPDGHFETPDYPNEHIQPTAYALMALSYALEDTASTKAATYLLNNFGYPTPTPTFNGWLEDGVEISEVTSEAVQAISSYIG